MNFDLAILNNRLVNKHIKKRDQNCHKGDFGRILLLCGSKGYTGAAALAATGALRSGAGLVYLGVPESIYAIEAVKLLEPIVFALPDENGMLSENAIDMIAPMLSKMDAVLIGCGLGQGQGTMAVMEYLIKNYQGPLVIDADGINLLSSRIHILRGRKAPTILTPHDGEFARIGGDVQSQDHIGVTVDMARKLGCTILRKGHTSIITDGKKIYVNKTGNAGMATGGSGDVLAGIIVSLIGQGIAPLEATACAAWLFGTSGDICAKRIGQYGMLPQDILQILPRLLP